MSSEYTGPPPTRPPEPYGTHLGPPATYPPPGYPPAGYSPFGQLAFAPTSPVPSTPPRSRKAAWLVASAAAVLGLVLAIAFHPFVTSTSSTASDDTVVQGSAGVPGPPDPCPLETPPANASAAAVAYLQAVNAETPTQVAISDRITNSGFVTSIDLTEQITSDRSFTRAVKQISFTATVQPQVTQLLDAITSYDNFLNLAASSASYYNAHQDEDNQLQEVRSTSAVAVRDALGLPRSTCQLNRP